MARSLNGSLLGGARRLELVDARNDAYDAWERGLSPEAVYWRNGAVCAFNKLVELVGHELADQLTGDWDDGRTWRDICYQAESVLRDQKAKDEKSQ